MADSTPAVSPCGAPGGGGGSGGNGGSEGGAQQGMGSMLFPIAIFILVFYFMIIRPQSKRKKQQESLLSGITRGDQIVTIGGIFGTVREVRDDAFTIEVAEGVRIRILKSAVQTKRNLTPTAASLEEKKD